MPAAIRKSSSDKRDVGRSMLASPLLQKSNQFFRASCLAGLAGPTFTHGPPPDWPVSTVPLPDPPRGIRRHRVIGGTFPRFAATKVIFDTSRQGKGELASTEPK